MKLAQLGRVNPKVITFLINAGANRSFRDSDGNTEQYYLNESLLQAALEGNTTTMKNLITRGADVNSQQFYSEIHRPLGTCLVVDNQTILIKLRIAQQDKVPADVINTLLNAGADLTLKDSEGRTADDNNTTLSDLYCLRLYKINPPKDRAHLDRSLRQEIQSSCNGRRPQTVLYLLSLGANRKSQEVLKSMTEENLVWFSNLLLANNYMNEQK